MKRRLCTALLAVLLAPAARADPTPSPTAVPATATLVPATATPIAATATAIPPTPSFTAVPPTPSLTASPTPTLSHQGALADAAVCPTGTPSCDWPGLEAHRGSHTVGAHITGVCPVKLVCRVRDSWQPVDVVLKTFATPGPTPTGTPADPIVNDYVDFTTLCDWVWINQGGDDSCAVNAWLNAWLNNS